MDFWQELWSEIGITPVMALGVIIASVVLYAIFALIMRFWGQRLYANRSGTGLAVVMVLGAVGGRSMLGPAPTMMGGIVCLATLLICESLFGVAADTFRLGHRRPVIVWSNGEFHVPEMRRYHLSRQRVWTTLRHAGITDLDHVKAVILEPDGTLSMIKHDKPPHASLLENVRGFENLTRGDESLR